MGGDVRQPERGVMMDEALGYEVVYTDAELGGMFSAVGVGEFTYTLDGGDVFRGDGLPDCIELGED